MKIKITAPFLSLDGYGKASREIIKALIQMENVELRLNLLPFANPEIIVPDELKEYDGKEAFKEGYFNLIITTPNFYKDYIEESAVCNLGMTYFDGKGRYSPLWEEGLNLIDALFLPSEFSKRIFEEANYKKPIYITPLGCDRKVYNAQVPPRFDEAKFTFLSFVDMRCPERKGFDLILESYLRTFSVNDPVHLFIKTNNKGALLPFLSKRLTAIVEETERMNFPSFEIENRRFSEEELASLYRASNVLLAPIRGEGFYLPGLEALSCEIPIIITDTGAQEYANFENPFILKIPVKQWVKSWSNNQHDLETLWAMPDYEVLNGIMAEIAKEPNFRKKNKKALPSLREGIERFTWEKTAGAIKESCLNMYEKLTGSKELQW